MSDPSEKIIVFDSFDNVITANLSKLKLDAYGIPCFLTDENFVSLYPIRNEVFPGVRLHVFETDLDRVKEVLAEEHSGEIEIPKCPSCHSKDIITGTSPGNTMNRWSLLLHTFLFMAPPAHHRKSFRCAMCGTEF